MKNYLKAFAENYPSIKEAVIANVANAINPERTELLMNIDDSGCISFTVSDGYSGNKIVHDDYIVLSSAGGDMKSVWELLPDIHDLLDYEAISEIKDKIPESKDEYIRAYIEDNHPEWIQEWFDESLPDILAYLDSTVEGYLENLMDQIEAEMEDMMDE